MRRVPGVEVKLVEGSNGSFDVIADGKLVYSKFQTGRFPRPDEVSKILKEHTKP